MCAAVAATSADGDELTVANVGDSRAYHWRAGRLRQVTRDQSLVAQLLEEGAISADEYLDAAAKRNPGADDDTGRHANVLAYEHTVPGGRRPELAA